MDAKTVLHQQRGHQIQQTLIAVDEMIALPNGRQLELITAASRSPEGPAVRPGTTGPVSHSGAPRSSWLVIVLPGGGYEFCSFREARNIALHFANHGIDSAVLNYQVMDEEDALSSGKGLGYGPMTELAHAVDELRSNEQLGYSNSGIVLCGFSAGGHLAASLCTRYDCQQLQAAGPWRSSLRPDGAILSYAVQSAVPEDRARMVFHCLTGSTDPQKWREFTTDDKVRPGTPPAFIWHTADDDVVPVRNALNYAQAMWRCGNTAELMVLPHGIHGLATATSDVEPDNSFAYADEHAALWLAHAVSFIKKFV